MPALDALADAPLPCSETTAGGDWATYGQDAMGQQHQANETSIGVDNVGQLQQAWKLGIIGGSGQEPFDTGYQSPPPIVASGCVFLNTGGHIVAYDLATGEQQWASDDTYDGVSLDTSGTFAVTVVDGRVHANLVNNGSPRAVAFDLHTGHTLWLGEPFDLSTTANQESSAIVADGIQVLFTTGPDFDPTAREGYALYDAATGERLVEHLTIPDTYPGPQVGGGVWGTPTYDAQSKTLYVGTSNPETKTSETPYDDSIVKLDLDRASPTFGTILDTYKGTPDSVTGYDNPLCQSVGENYVNAGVYGSSPACGQMDVDFGIGPTLFRSAAYGGHLLGAATQKSGWLHVYDFETTGEPREVFSKQLWVSMSFLGGNIARSATDGHTLYVAGNPGVLYAFDIDHGFEQKWAAPLTGLPMKGGNVALANGVVYYVDEPGLKAFRADDGTPIAIPGAVQPGSSTGSGVAIAGHYVIANHYGVIAAYELP